MRLSSGDRDGTVHLGDLGGPSVLSDESVKEGGKRVQSQGRKREDRGEGDVMLGHTPRNAGTASGSWQRSGMDFPLSLQKERSPAIVLFLAPHVRLISGF